MTTKHPPCLDRQRAPCRPAGCRGNGPGLPGEPGSGGGGLWQKPVRLAGILQGPVKAGVFEVGMKKLEVFFFFNKNIIKKFQN